MNVVYNEHICECWKPSNRVIVTILLTERRDLYSRERKENVSLLSITSLSCSVNHILLHPIPCRNRSKNEMKRSYQTISLKHMLNKITKSRCSPKGASQVALVVKNPPVNAGDIRDKDSIPGLERSSGEGNGNSLQYSRLRNLMGRGAWQATVMGVQRVRHDLVTKPPHHSS